MEFVDLKSQFARLEGQIDSRIKQVLRHGHYILGPEVFELEEKLAEYCGVEHVVTVGNGTDALVLSLMALGVGPGDAVMTSAFSFFATAEAISLVGATPVFVDIDKSSFNLSATALESAISDYQGDECLKAVIAVDLFGLPAEYPKLESICNTHGLYLVEDAAQSFGASIGPRRAGSFGDIATTSFFPAKPLGCYGDGGAVITDDFELAEMVRSLRVHGKGRDKYDNVRIGMNSRLDTIQAAILLCKMEIFPEELALRAQVAASYSRELKTAQGIRQLPPEPGEYRSAWAQFTLCHDSRDEVRARLSSLGIPSAVYYDKTLGQQPAYAELGETDNKVPVARRACLEVLSLPMGPYVSEHDLEDICSALQY